VQQPHLPLWVGGHWAGGFVEPVLRRVARFADVFFPTWTPIEGYRVGSALHVRLFLENLTQASLVFNGLQSCHGQRALLVYHYPTVEVHRLAVSTSTAWDARRPRV
jgi:hypothetical protein